MKAIRIHRHGGPNVLAYEDVVIGQPGAGEIVVRNRASCTRSRLPQRVSTVTNGVL